MKTKIFTREELQQIRKERTRTVEVDLALGTLTTLEIPNPFPTLPGMGASPPPPPPPPPPMNHGPLEPPCTLPLSRPGPTDQRQKPVDMNYSGLIRRKPRRAT